MVRERAAPATCTETADKLIRYMNIRTSHKQTVCWAIEWLKIYY